MRFVPRTPRPGLHVIPARGRHQIGHLHGAPLPHAVLGLKSPPAPSRSGAAREELNIRPRAARLDDRVQFIRLARVLALARGEEIHLPPTGGARAGILAPHAEQHELGHVAKIETDPAAIRSAVLADLVPDEVALVLEPPRGHHAQALGQQRVRHPEIQVSPRGGDLADRERGDLLERHGGISRETAMFRRDLAGAIGKSPWRVRENRLERGAAETAQIAHHVGYRSIPGAERRAARGF